MIVAKRRANSRAQGAPCFRSGRWGSVMPLDENFEHDEVYERGAILLTALACPQESDAARSLQLYLSLCGKALWLKHLMKPEDWTPIQVRPQYVFRDPKVIDRDVAYVVKRLGERMVAGRMAIALLRKAVPGGLQRLPKEIRRLSVNQLALYVLEDAGQTEPGNVERRVWAPSRPVIHIAARRSDGRAGAKQARGTLRAGKLDQAFIEKVVRLAEELETLVAEVPKFPVRPEQLIRFRLG